MKHTKDNVHFVRVMEYNYKYDNYVDFATRIYNWLRQKNMTLVGIRDRKTYGGNDRSKEWLDCHCILRSDLTRPYQEIPFDMVIMSPQAMAALFSEGLADAFKRSIPFETVAL